MKTKITFAKLFMNNYKKDREKFYQKTKDLLVVPNVRLELRID